MIKKIIIVILVLATIWFIGDTNLKGNLVYYAKHSPSSNVRDLELMMYADNLDILGKKDGFKYKHKIQENKSVQNVEKNVYFGYSMYDDEQIYIYIYMQIVDKTTKISMNILMFWSFFKKNKPYD